MATANVAGGDAAIVIAAAGFLEGSAETLSGVEVVISSKDGHTL